MDEYIGIIKIFAGDFAPRGWAFCDGQLLPIAQNQTLFSLLGKTYGGDGITSFSLPDLRGRAPIHAGTGPGFTTRKLGENGGKEHTYLSLANLPSHTHGATQTSSGIVVNVKVQASSAAATLGAPTDGAVLAAGTKVIGRESEPINMYNETTPDIALGGIEVVTNPIESPITIERTGGDIPCDNMQPYLVMKHIICMEGLYPSRG